MSSLNFDEFVTLCEPQLSASAVPKHLWPRLHEKLEGEVFDSGEYFQMLCEEEEERRKWTVIAIRDIHLDDPSCIFLIDHCWTFRPQNAREQLNNTPGLIERMSTLLELDAAIVVEGEQQVSDAEELTVDGGGQVFQSDSKSTIERSRDMNIGNILQGLWLHAQTYCIRTDGEGGDENEMPVWYIPDEFGCRIAHCSDPSFRLIPFYYLPSKTAFSLLFPIREVKSGEEVTRDYGNTPLGRAFPEYQSAILHPWYPIDMSEYYYERSMVPDSFFTKGRELDDLPEASDKDEEAMVVDEHRRSSSMKIYADNDQLLDHLKTFNWQRVDEMAEADILWLRRHFHDYRNLARDHPKCLINQFPFESNLTVKDLLAVCIQNNSPKLLDPEIWFPSWLPTTFNLHTELFHFIAHFQRRAKENLDNTWIVKPWNLARGLDMHVTDSLAQIIRLVESGPKIASKYIDDPVLFLRDDIGEYVKFDLRFIVFLRSLNPLTLLIYDQFWIRFAQKQFSLTNLDDVSTHFTVFNYSDKAKVLNMKCEEFIEKLHRQYPAIRWTEIEKEIHDIIRETFTMVSTGNPPRAMAHNQQSRAMYGVDIMLKWRIDDAGVRHVQPVLLEVNFMPDCDRACQFYPDFADTVFQALFGHSIPGGVTVI